MTFKQIGRASLYLGDCEELIPKLSFKRASGLSLVTDPPYGINIGRSQRLSISRGFDDEDWDDKPPSPQILMELVHFPEAIIWGGNYFGLPALRGWLIWDKLNEGRDFGDAELAWTNLDQVIRIFRLRPMNMDGGKVHPTQKPVALMKFCLNFLTPAHTVFDPYMGSGSTGVAAVQMGRDFIGIERSARHFDTACSRLDEAQRQLDLFAPTPPVAITQPTLPLPDGSGEGTP